MDLALKKANTGNCKNRTCSKWQSPLAGKRLEISFCVYWPKTPEWTANNCSRHQSKEERNSITVDALLLAFLPLIHCISTEKETFKMLNVKKVALFSNAVSVSQNCYVSVRKGDYSSSNIQTKTFLLPYVILPTTACPIISLARCVSKIIALKKYTGLPWRDKGGFGRILYTV